MYVLSVIIGGGCKNIVCVSVSVCVSLGACGTFDVDAHHRLWGYRRQVVHVVGMVA
jgi:hypothetical protein